MIITTAGQKKLNLQDVRKGTIRFIISFVILVGVSFLAVFYFFKSSQLQNKQTQNQIDEYNEMLDRNNLLQMKMDTIYNKMTMIGTEQVSNDNFLRHSILNDLEESKKMIGKDSADNLQHYAELMVQIQSILDYKAKLGELKADERNVTRMLEICSGKTVQVNKRMKTMTRAPLKGRLFNRH